MESNTILIPDNVHLYNYVCIYTSDFGYNVHVVLSVVFMKISVFDKLIWHTIGPKSFLFGTVQSSLWASGAFNYAYIVTNSINSSLIGSRCIPNGTHTNYC